jgi:hypothetical protein
MDRKKLIQEMKRLAKMYGACRVNFNKSIDFSAEANGHTRHITINSKLVDNIFFDPKNRRKHLSILISTLFHELGHLHCIFNDLWYNYHRDESYYLVKKVALKAERWVDKWGMKEMRKFYPKLPFDKAYETKEDIQYLYEDLARRFGK